MIGAFAREALEAVSLVMLTDPGFNPRGARTAIALSFRFEEGRCQIHGFTMRVRRKQSTGQHGLTRE